MDGTSSLGFCEGFDLKRKKALNLSLMPHFSCHLLLLSFYPGFLKP